VLEYFRPLWFFAILPIEIAPKGAIPPTLRNTALDLQQKLKPYLRSSQEKMVLRSFHGIYSSFV